MNLEELISQKTSNPFVLWPRYDFKKYINQQILTIDLQAKHEKVFEYYHNSQLVCYFHLKHLEWDSLHYGIKCGQIKYFHIDETLSENQFATIIPRIKNDFLKQLLDQKYQFLFCDIDSQSFSNYFLQKLGFNYIVSWIDGFKVPDESVDLSENFTTNIDADDIETIANLAKYHYYKGGRFYSDKCFNIGKINDMYYNLVKNSYANNEVIITIKENQYPLGAFISKQVVTYEEFDHLRVAHLRFLVINEEYRHKKLGQQLFASILNYFHNKCDIVLTGLETKNIVSLNLHNKFNFKYNYLHNAYHLWIKK